MQTLPSKTALHGRHDILIGLFLVVITLAVYARVGQFEFAGYDDDVYITGNMHVRSGLTFKNLVWSFTNTRGDNWHPLTWLSHMLDVELFGLNAGMHHLTSLLLHIANALLLFLVLTKMTGDSVRSGFVAALFALHPLNVESVAWIAERKNVLSTFFWMLTMFSYAGYIERPGVKRYLLVLVVFVCGLMSKPMLVTLPLVLLLMDVWPLGRLKLGTLTCDAPISRQRTATHLFLEKVPLIILAVAAGIMTLRAERVYTFDLVPLHARISNSLLSYLAYIQKMIWPRNLACFYPYPNFFPDWKVAVAGMVLAAISFVAVKQFSRRPYVLMGWLWYLITLAPVIGLVQVGTQAMADRYAYVPLVGWFIIIVWGISDILKHWPGKKLWFGTSAIVLLAILAIFSWEQTQYWKNRKTLFEHALAVTDNNYLAHNNLGYVLAAEGRTDAAIRHYREALRIRPDYAEARSNLGLALEKQGHIQAAIDLYKEALRSQPNLATAHNNLGSALARQGHVDDAEAQYMEALRIQPDLAEAHNNLGAILAGKGRMDDAVMHYMEALRIQPDLAVAHANLGVILARQGRLKDAADHYMQALRIQPDFLDTHYNLGNVLARQGRLDDAIAQYLEALRIRPDNAAVHNNLGIVMVRKGDVEGAIGHFQEALRIKPGDVAAEKNLERALLNRKHSGN